MAAMALALQEKTIRKYVETTSHDGGMTVGEKGIRIPHNLRWLNGFEY